MMDHLSAGSSCLIAGLIVAMLCVFTATAGAAQPYRNSLGMKMIPIPTGSFRMGALNPTDGEALEGPPLNKQGDWDESPTHDVTISQPFYMSEAQVTIEQFRQFRSEYRGADVLAPYAAGLSWDDCNAFCQYGVSE